MNYNAGDWLARSVASVAKQSFADFECLIVDNGSTDGSLERLPGDMDARFRVIALGDNTGFAAGNNAGASEAKGEWLALLNPDAFARSDWLESLLSETEHYPAATMVGSAQYMALESNIYDGVGDCYHLSGLAWRAWFGHKVDGAPLPETCEVFGPCAAAALYHRETFLRLGGFDERYFCYHEDVDLAFRMRLDGGMCVQSCKAIVDHVSSGISGRASDFAVYHGTRNRMWTFVKCMPALGLWLLLPAHIFMSFALLIWAIFRPGRFKPTARGLWHGLLGLPSIWRSRKVVHQGRKVGLAGLWPMLAINPVKTVNRGVHSRSLPDTEQL